MSRERRFERVPGLRDYANAAPWRIDHVECLREQLSRARVAARLDGRGITVGQRRFAFQRLDEQRVDRREQAVGRESGNRHGNAVALVDERPFFRTHHGRHVARCNQGIEAGVGRIEQYGNGRPGPAAARQQQQVGG